MTLAPRHLQGLTGRDLAVGVALTPIFLPLWVLLAAVRPVVWAYDVIMEHVWDGR